MTKIFLVSVPDGKPVIGPVPGLSKIFLATGHEGLGLSLVIFVFFFYDILTWFAGFVDRIFKSFIILVLFFRPWALLNWSLIWYWKIL